MSSFYTQNQTCRLVAALLPFFILGLTACIKSPEIHQLEDIRFLTLRDSILESELDITVLNQNKVGATVERTQSEIYIEGEHVGSSESNERFQLKPGGRTTLALAARLNVHAFSRLFPILLEKNSARVEVEGVYEVDAGVSLLNIRKKTTADLNIKDQIEPLIRDNLEKSGFRISKIRPNRLGIDSTILQVEIQMENSFNFPYDIETISLDLHLGDNRSAFGSWSTDAPRHMAPLSRNTVRGEVRVKNFSAVQGLGSLFGKRTLSIRGNAGIQVAGKPFSIPIRQELPVSPSLFMGGN